MALAEQLSISQILLAHLFSVVIKDMQKVSKEFVSRVNMLVESLRAVNCTGADSKLKYMKI